MTPDEQCASDVAPFRLFPSQNRAAPVVFDSPHSGRVYPNDFHPILPTAELFGYEDRLVDLVVADAPDYGITLLTAEFPRAYIDPNRSEDDLEPEIAGPDWSTARNPVYALKGIGLIFRTSLDGRPIYERPLSAEEINRRISRYWRPYHQALEDALSYTQQLWGEVWHINWHSMRPIGDALSSDPGAIRPDFVLSDLDGTSAEPGLPDLVEHELRAMGYSLARNRPFKGGYITALHGRPDEGRHSIQVEINRSLYLNLKTLEVTPGAKRLRGDLARLAASVADYARSHATDTGSRLRRTPTTPPGQ